VVSVLAFDTGGAACTAAVLRDGAVAARRLAPMERGHAEALMPMIDAVLEEAGIAVAALDLIAVTTGPGAFTGLRIGLAAARGLALASGVPALGITRFAAAAAAVPRERQAGKRLVIALDSKRRELYLQAFAEGEAEGDGALVPPEAVPDWLPPGPLLLAGDAAPALARLIAARAGVEQAPGPGLVDAVDVARLAAAEWRPGLRPPPPLPLYLRAPDTTLPRRAGGGP
jgi:tRNA threonylcarbamoyladenosine biosynthesis protein TsaB